MSDKKHFTAVSKRDLHIFGEVCDMPETGNTKAYIARQNGISPRTLGRVVDRVEAAIIEASAENTNKEISALFGYHVSLRDIQDTLEKHGKRAKTTNTTSEKCNVDGCTTQDIGIFNAVCDNGASKAAIARHFGVSPRTVGRAVERVEKAIVTLADDCTDEGIAKKLGYQVKIHDIESTLEKYGIGEVDTCASSEPQQPDFTYEVIGSYRSITITRSDGETRSLESSNKLFGGVLEIVERGLDNETLAEAFDAMSFTTAIQRYSDGMLLIDTESNTVVVYPNTAHEVVFQNSLADTLLSEVYNNIDGKDFKALTSFTKKLALADRSEVIAELFDFVSANDITIDEEGYVICWKRVRENYMDIFSGTFDNTPGQVCEIPAHTVDTDRHNTCSYGLHVCSKSYLPHFGMGRGDRVVKVRVHPRDFIAIPSDYANAKARVSRYEVLEDVTEEMME